MKIHLGILLGRDFRQALPVIMRGTRTRVIEVYIKSNPFREHFLHLKLAQNMISEGGNEFKEWFLDIGQVKTLAIQIYKGYDTNFIYHVVYRFNCYRTLGK